MPQLSGEDLQDLHRALLDAFPTRDDLAQLLTFRLDMNLEEIAGDSNLKDAAFATVNWAEATGRTRALIAAATAQNPGNPRLAATAVRLLKIIDNPPHGVARSGRWWRTLTTRRANLVFGAAWISVLALGVASSVVRLPADVTLDVEARTVTMRLGGRDDRDVTLIAGARLASVAAQRLAAMVLNGGAVEVASPTATGALSAEGISNFTLAAPGGTILQIEASPDEQGSFKLLLQQRAASALFRASRVRAIRCGGCDQPAVQGFMDASRAGGLVRVQGARDRMALLLASDGPAALRDMPIDRVETLGFNDRLEERTVSTIVRGTVSYREASAGPVPIDRGARLRLSTLENGSLTLTAGSVLHVHFVGRAQRIGLVEGGVTRDIRPTAFAVLLHRPAVLAGIAVLLLLVSWPRFVASRRPHWERAS
jgi:hypothetical protein